MWTIPPSGGVLRAQVQRDRSLHLGNARVTPGSPAIEGRESDEWLLAVKGTIHRSVSSSCTSGKKCTGAERGCEPRPALKNQSFSREGLGLGRLLTFSPILKAARASMAVNSGSGAYVSPSADAAINILSLGGAPNEMLAAPWDEPAKSPWNRTGLPLREE